MNCRRGLPLFFLAVWATLFGTAPWVAFAEVTLIAPSGYVPGVPFAVRVESRDGLGALDKTLWNAVATLTPSAGVTVSTNRVALRNGLGTALLTVSGTNNFTLEAAVEDERAIKAIRYRGGEAVTLASGTLAGESSAWSGVVHVTGDVSVPSGHTLTINPDTIVVVAGIASGTAGTRLVVNGAIRSLGTEAQPVVISTSDASLNWGQIAHQNARDSIYLYTLIAKAGRVPGEGHTGAGPAFRANNSTITFDHSVVSDLTAEGSTIGKVMMATGSNLTFRDSVLTRARMGPEITGTALFCTNTYILDMTGPDDADGIYLHDSGTRPLLMIDCVAAGGDDDAVDTFGAKVVIENCILRDWANPNEDAKGVSAFNGEVILRRCLIVNCFAGVSTKSNGPLGIARLDHCTILGIDRGVSAATKENAPAGNLTLYLTNCVFRAADALYSDFGPEKFVSVTYCNLSEPWPGAGNRTDEPVFADASANDFRPRPGSPLIDAGDPASPLDGNGSRADMGYETGQTFGGVVINEIMYQPASEDPREEYIELLNTGASAINLARWRFTDGVEFTFGPATLAPGGCIVVAADLETFGRKYPGVTNVVGNWTGTLSNSREEIELEDANGIRRDQVRYADEGDWAARRRGPLHFGYRGWEWFAAHDGLGRSLERMQPTVSNNNGQNWAASRAANGTPGGINSAFHAEVAPIIENVAHAPLVPKSTEPVIISARISQAESASVYYRVSQIAPGPFQWLQMRDDGRAGDTVAGDGVFSALLPAQTNNAVVEFQVQASGVFGKTRVWPAPPIRAADGTMAVEGPNALYQVDDSAPAGSQPLYKLIMSEAEWLDLQTINSSFAFASSDAEMNATFISIDSTGTALRYLTGARNRGHGSRPRKPNNFRVNFRGDEPWKGARALNLNAQMSWLQVLGSALNLKSGVAGAYSRAVQLRVNNTNPVFTGPPDVTHGWYAANEVIDADWAKRHFPNDSEGNVYRAIRDLVPPSFDYRTREAYPFLFGPEAKESYTNTWFKTTNESEDDWTDLIAMLRVMGINGTEPFTPENVRRVIHLEQWIRHLAVMNLLGNAESGLNGGFNDDYFMYRGVKDPRFVLMYYDLDQILGFNGSFSTTSSLFSAANPNGAGAALGRFLNTPEFQALYYATLRDLLETSFSEAEFNALVEQTLGDFVPEVTRGQLKDWMAARRTFVLGQLPAETNPSPRIVISGPPRTPTPSTSAVFLVSGDHVTHYAYSLNGARGPEMSAAVPIVLTDLPSGTNVLQVLGRNQAGAAESSVTVAWVVDTAWPGVRINELIASRSGGLPDEIELYNDGPATVNLAGFSLSDRRLQPGKYVFPGGSLPPGGYLSFEARAVGLPMDANGEALFLFDRDGRLLDLVEFGPQLEDSSIGRAGENGAWTLTTPTLGAANSAGALGDSRRVRINEWLAAGAEDFIELYNPEALPVDLGGHFLTDHRAGNPTRHALAPLTFIGAAGRVVLQPGASANPSALPFALAAEQGEIALLGPAQQVIDSVVYGPQRVGISQGRLPDGGSRIATFETPTPGAANFLPLTRIVISEILANTDSPLEDAVELHNPTSAPIDLSGWFLSDSMENARKYQFPSNSVVAAGGFFVVYEAQFNGPAALERFALSSAGEEVFLSEASHGLLTGYHGSARFGASADGVSLGRIETPLGPRFWPLRARTFGSDSPATLEAFRRGLGASNAPPLIGPVVISQIMYDPPGSDAPLEFVRLRNVTGNPVPLFDPRRPTNTWRMTGGIELQFPAITLGGGETLTLVGFDPSVPSAARDAFDLAYPDSGSLLGPFSGNLDNASATLELQAPDPAELAVRYVAIDRVDYKNAAPWPVLSEAGNQFLQRSSESSFGNDPANWQASRVSANVSLAARRAGAGLIELEFTLDTNIAYEILVTDALGGAWNLLREFPTGIARVETLAVSARNRAAFYVVRRRN